MELQSLKPSHMHVMRLLALGKNTLREICDAYGLNYQSYVAISNTTLFKAGLQKLVAEINDREIEQAEKDPVRVKLAATAQAAALRLAMEVDNTGEDASASTRIKAAESILDRLGYSQRQEATQPTQTIILNVSASKLAILQNIVTDKNLAPLAKVEPSDSAKDTAGSALQPRDARPAVPLLEHAVA